MQSIPHMFASIGEKNSGNLLNPCHVLYGYNAIVFPSPWLNQPSSSHPQSHTTGPPHRTQCIHKICWTSTGGSHLWSSIKSRHMTSPLGFPPPPFVSELRTENFLGKSPLSTTAPSTGPCAPPWAAASASAPVGGSHLGDRGLGQETRYGRLIICYIYT